MYLLNKFVKIGLFVVLSLLLSHCGGIKTIGHSQKQRTYLYSKGFLKKIQQVKYLYSLGQLSQALRKLQALKRKKGLGPTEQALINNLFGIIRFSQKRYSNAIKYFEKALKTAELDSMLAAQIKLNLGSSYYKAQKFIRAYAVLKTTEDRSLRGLEKIKYFRLFFILAKQLGDEGDALRGLVKLMGTYETISEIKEHHYFDSLVHGFNQLGRNEKVRFLEEYAEDQNLAAGHLGLIEAKELLYKGERKRAFELIEWVDENFSARDELQVLVSNFEREVKNLSRIETNAIGIVLPFSRKKETICPSGHVRN